MHMCTMQYMFICEYKYMQVCSPVYVCATVCMPEVDFGF